MARNQDKTDGFLLPNADTCIVACSAAEARFYLSERRFGDWRLLDSMGNPDATLREQELNSDRPGRAFDRFGRGRLVTGDDAGTIPLPRFPTEVVTQGLDRNPPEPGRVGEALQRHAADGRTAAVAGGSASTATETPVANSDSAASWRSFGTLPAIARWWINAGAHPDVKYVSVDKPDSIHPLMLARFQPKTCSASPAGDT